MKEAGVMLDKLVWPTQNRYIILYNEPNHAKEWGNTLDPEGYATVLVEGAKVLKQISEDFYILPAGLDVAAASDGASMDAATYLRRMVAAKPELLTLIDGWTSHAYPNPAFSGSPHASGRTSVRSYDWELALLQSLGLQKKLPVFITETGWIHSEGKVRGGGHTPETVAEYITIASQGAWSDPRIVAVTPFLFNYQDVPFDHFSMKKIGSQEYYAHYFAYKGIPKEKGKPAQIERYTVLKPFIPSTLIAESVYTLTAEIKNEGQAILSATDGYELVVTDASTGFSLLAENVPTLEPGEKGTITVHLKTPQKGGKATIAVAIHHGDKDIPLESHEVTIIPPPSLAITAHLGWKSESSADEVTVLVYKDDDLIQKHQHLSLQKGILTVQKLTNIIPEEKYRIVMLVPYYLPRQTIQAIHSGETKIEFRRFLPLDVNRDGAFTLEDIGELFTQKPHDVWQRFVGP